MNEFSGILVQEMIGTLETSTVELGILVDGFVVNNGEGGPSTIDDVSGLREELDDLALPIAWADIQNKPAAFAPTAHNQPISTVDGLEDALLDIQEAFEDTQPFSAVLSATTAAFTTAQFNKLATIQEGAQVNATLAHTHPMGEVTGLIATLATKQNVVGRTALFERTDFLNTTVTSQGAFVAFNLFGGTIGTAASADYTPNHHGIWLVRSAANLNSGYGALTNADSTMLSPGMTYDFCFKTPSTLANTQYTLGHINVGNHTSPSTNGVWISVAAGVMTGNTASAGIASATATISTLSADTWYHVRITVNENITSILYEVYSDAGTLLGSASLDTNIPTLNTARLRTGFMATGNSGVATDVIKPDYMEFKAPGLQRGALV